MAIHGLVLPFPRVRSGRSTRLAAPVAKRALLVATVALGVALAPVTVGPRFLPYRALPVLTGSMEPAIAAGSVAFVLPVRADAVAAGDVITFTHPLRPTEYVTHRVVAVEDGPAGRSFITRGDANELADAWRVTGSGEGWRVALAVPALGTFAIVLAGARGLLLGGAMLALAALALVEIWRPRPRSVRPVPRTA